MPDLVRLLRGVVRSTLQLLLKVKQELNWADVINALFVLSDAAAGPASVVLTVPMPYGCGEVGVVRATLSKEDGAGVGPEQLKA